MSVMRIWWYGKVDALILVTRLAEPHTDSKIDPAATISATQLREPSATPLPAAYIETSRSI